MGKKQKIPIGNLKTACYCRVSAEWVWIYCRVDGGDPMVLETQRRQLESYASEHGWKIAGVTNETCNGLSLSRPGLAEMSKAVEAGCAGVVLISDLSRLCRSIDAAIYYWQFLKQNHVRLWTLRDGEVDLSMEIAICNGLSAARMGR